MNLPSNQPNFFLADLPREAELTAGLITDACQTLKRNREKYLKGRSTESIIRVLANLGRDWQTADYPFRERLLQAGQVEAGFSAPVLAAGLDHFFQQLTGPNLDALLRQEIGDGRRLDEFHRNAGKSDDARSSMVIGPQLIAHIAPGNTPMPALTDMVMGLLMRSAQFIKCASGQSLVPRTFAHSLYEVDHKLGACLEIADWKGGSEHLETALFAEADCVLATGSNETLGVLRKRLPQSSRFIGRGETVSFGYVTIDAFDRNAALVAENAAKDVAAWNQRGCLSPHVIYVEEKINGAGEDFAKMLSKRLEGMEQTHPRGTLRAADAAAIASRRAFYEVRAAHSPDTMMWVSRESTAWTVVLESDPRFQISCQNRFIYVKAVPNLDMALQGAEPVRESISTVGLACLPTQTSELAQRLAHWGAKRICLLGQMQRPPLSWRHDGRPPLGDLLTWVDWEE